MHESTHLPPAYAKGPGNASPPVRKSTTVDTTTLRAMAHAMLSSRAPLPVLADMRERETALRGAVARLMDEVGGLTGPGADVDDPQVCVAQAAVALARRTLRVTPASDCLSTYRAARALARHVVALCGHYETVWAHRATDVGA